MNRKLSFTMATLVLGAAIMAVNGCKENGSAEKAGKAVDDAAAKVGEKVGEGLEKAGEAVKDATKK